ncbi:MULTISPECIES: hypothetical protein [Helicobacter]|uniref:DUF4149 domain-containing protein n=2 Tax=Helicobacter bilis TaxID=37372 RepID=C3XIB1_9HELI|nr:MULTISPECIES: hypothetical protein [Helicobacter]AQQ59086.1 hypothetical protein XJ32_02030 [Helicobacter bilis]EEO24750.1 hypothetical protein HRAG_01807 [Helicobacter bilis ATCC 43879]MDY5950884.1 hypothetical protein [Helicobacter sp.]
MIAKILAGFYLLLVGVCIGGIIVTNISESIIMSIDIVFRNNDFSTTLITKYDQGIILAPILLQVGYMLVFAAIFMLFYETMSYRFQKSTFFVWACNVLNAILMFLFGLFYAPNIAKIFNEEPKVMASPDSESFLNQSELILKLLLATLLIAFFARIILMYKRGVTELRLTKQKDDKKPQ